jgi:hypothetical protein
MQLSYTIPENPSPAFATSDQSAIDIDVFFEHIGRAVRYTCVPVDPGCKHSEEIYARAIAGEFGPVAPAPTPLSLEPDYLAFWDVLMASTIYASIREQSFVSLPMNTLATEFIALIGDAKAGRPNEAAIQASIDAILAAGTFTEEQLTELQDSLEAGNLSFIYVLPA